jgi:hypothetical protein
MPHQFLDEINMNIVKLKEFLRQFTILRQCVQAGKNFINITLYPLHTIYIRYFITKHKINKNIYILFVYGHTSDIFSIASLLDAFAVKYGQTLVLAPKQHAETFRLLSNNNNIQYLWLNELEINKLRKATAVTGVYEANDLDIYKGSKLLPGIIKTLYLVLYPNVHALIMADRLSYRDAITWMMGLDKNTPHRYASYSESDKSAAAAILTDGGTNVNRIALINPICYTHKNISVNAWKGVADAFVACGYKPIFNLKRNPDDKNHQYNIVPDGFPIVEIPAYLVPVCADMVGMGCARHGGGFDLLEVYAPANNNNLLICLSPKVILSGSEKPDPPYEITKEFYKNFSGKILSHNVLLDSYDDEQEAYTKVMDVLKPASI